MKPKDGIELKEVPLVHRENYPPEDTHCLRMDCIITYVNPTKNMTTSSREPLREYGLRRLTD